MVNEPVNWKKEAWEYLKTITISVVVVLLVTHFIARPVRVEGPSMYPTLQSGELGFTNIIALKTGRIKRFDIVVAYLREKNEQIVKRVIGLPGETIEFRDDILYIDGTAVAEDFFDSEYLNEQRSQEEDKLFTKDFGPVTLGADEYFLMGDNRLHSTDSRFFGAFSRSDITSKDVYVWWPLNHWKAE